MASRTKSFLIQNLAGGINKYIDEFEIKDNESPDMQNMEFFGLGALKKRGGYSKLGDAVGTVHPTGLACYKTASVNEILVTTGTALKKYNTGDGGWDAVSGVTYTTTKDTTYAQAESKLFIANGADALSYYDGSTLTKIAGKTPSFVIYWNKRIYCNDSTNPDTLYYTGTGANIDSFGTGDGGGSLTFLPGSGAMLKGATVFGNYLYISIGDAWYRASINTSGDHVIELVVKAKGAVSHRTIKQMGNDIVYLSTDGVFSLGEVANYSSVRLTDLGSRINPILETATGSEKTHAAAAYYDYKYILSYRSNGATYNNELLVYDTRYKTWLYWSGIRANSFLDYEDGDGDTHLYFADDSVLRVYELDDSTSDDGAAIDSYFYTKMFDFGDFSLEKLIMDISILFGNVYGSLDISLIFEDETVSKSLSIGQAADSGGIGRYKIGLKMIGDSSSGSAHTSAANTWKYFDVGEETTMAQLKFSNNAAGEDFQIKKILLTYIPFKHYKRDDERFIS
ncbi:MAG: hypothetical protein BWY74_00149 [Firmicutes bacterium ADurb.Bin419]|nr:MAG: hypothetical protein BWY74_00149 [Firmicutes bacterium ADurb.Bin419]